MNEPKEWLAKPGGIAERLRDLHDATGLTGKQLAEQLGWAESKVSRVRKGVVAPSEADLDAWAQATGAEDAVPALRELLAEAMKHRRRDFSQRMARGQADVQRDYNRLVEESQIIRYFDTAWIVGFLQTRDYARRVFEEMCDLHGPKDDVDEAIAVRLARQALLADKSRRFDLLMDESVLLRTVFGADVMVPQLHFLLTWLDSPTARVGILPLRAAHRRTPQNSFQMYDDLVIVESFDGEVEREPALYERVFDDMWAVAAVGPDARPLIRAAIEAWEGRSPA
jgi:transcriptional regulator with XRE-family HTH domain